MVSTKTGEKSTHTLVIYYQSIKYNKRIHKSPVRETRLTRQASPRNNYYKKKEDFVVGLKKYS